MRVYMYVYCTYISIYFLGISKQGLVFLENEKGKTLKEHMYIKNVNITHTYPQREKKTNTTIV